MLFAARIVQFTRDRSPKQIYDITLLQYIIPPMWLRQLLGRMTSLPPHVFWLPSYAPSKRSSCCDLIHWMSLLFRIFLTNK